MPPTTTPPPALRQPRDSPNGYVQFHVQLDLTQPVSRCNCTICTKMAMSAAMVKPAAFTLLAGEQALGSYEWGGKIARRFFCANCGIQCFSRGHLVELGGDYVAINVNALDDVEPAELSAIYWDDRHNNWHAGPRATPWPIRTAALAAAR